MPRTSRHLDVLQAQTFAQLQTLPGIGPTTAGDLIRAGVTSLDDLAHRDPNRLFDAMMADGRARDPQVLAALAGAVHYARTGTWQTGW
jgi:predicted flap endonuclease-1-like 5' DNA nuclease